MSTKKKALQAAAGAAGGAGPLAIEDVFSTYLYTGTGENQNIVNGIDLAGEGGLVWGKSRSNAVSHVLFDTLRGIRYPLSSNSSDGQYFYFDSLQSFNSDGFTIKNNNAGAGSLDASWTFRKAPRFFDVVTYTGDGNFSRQIQHNLGVVPGAVFIKRTDAAANWIAVNRIGVGSGYGVFYLNATNAQLGSSLPMPPTSTAYVSDTTFGPQYYTVGGATEAEVNASGASYVAYLFAHDPVGDPDVNLGGMISCGSYTGNGSTDGPEIDLGWEPQWLLVKGATAGGAYNWIMLDSMRGLSSGSSDAYLAAESSSAESSVQLARVTPTGFKIESDFAMINNSTDTYIYIAIRRGPMRVPTSGTEVFDAGLRTGSTSIANTNSSVLTDASIILRRDSSTEYNSMQSRLTGNKTLQTNSTSSEFTGLVSGWDTMTGFKVTGSNGAANTGSLVDYSFKRAPNFFDVVAYTGGASSYNHNLGVEPELIITKSRTDGTRNWGVYAKSLGLSQLGYLNTTGAFFNVANYWGTGNNATTFNNGVNGLVNGVSGENYIAYLFASLPGISKVGSYNGNGTSQTIDCGFTSGARFVLIKRTDTTGSWNVLDTARGIVDTDDPYLHLNDSFSEFLGVDVIDPHPSGFTLPNGWDEFNASGGQYIFYAIA